jgi:hypothetical protein
MEHKRHYRRQQDLRELLINEGVRLMLEADPAERDAVTFARVFDRIEQAGYPRVTKGSVLGAGRTWASQRAYQLDVEAATARALADIDVELTATMAAATAVLENADLTTKAGRAHALRQLCRVAGEASFIEFTAAESWRLWIGLWGRTVSKDHPGGDSHVVAALKDAQTAIITQLVTQVHTPLAQLVGYRPRPELGSPDDTMHRLAVAIVAISDGLALRERLAPDDFAYVDRPTGPHGQSEPWHPFSLALEALVNQHLEPDPKRSRRRTSS